MNKRMNKWASERSNVPFLQSTDENVLLKRNQRIQVERLVWSFLRSICVSSLFLSFQFHVQFIHSFFHLSLLHSLLTSLSISLLFVQAYNYKRYLIFVYIHQTHTHKTPGHIECDLKTYKLRYHKRFSVTLSPNSFIVNIHISTHTLYSYVLFFSFISIILIVYSGSFRYLEVIRQCSVFTYTSEKPHYEQNIIDEGSRIRVMKHKYTMSCEREY